MTTAQIKNDFLEEAFQLFGGYFGNQSIEEGVEEILFLSLDHYEYHKNWLEIVKNAIDEINNSETKILEIIESAIHISDKNEAKMYLQNLMELYVHRYKEESESNATN